MLVHYALGFRETTHLWCSYVLSRINLSSQHCQRLRLVVHTALRPKLFSKMLEGSYFKAYDTGSGERQVVVHGIIYTRGQVTHRMRTLVDGAGGTDCYMEFDWRVGESTAPPKDIKPISILGSLLDKHTRSINVDCTGWFTYRLDEGWKSQFPLPVRIPTDESAKVPWTHIESLSFSGRDGDELLRSAQIKVTEEGDITHMITARFSALFSEDIGRRGLTLVRHLSRPFVYVEEVAQ